MEKEKKTNVRKVGLVGGGEGAAKLLPIFLDLDLIQVEFVVDKKREAPAMELAREKEIPTSTELIKTLKESSVDLIFELTGFEEVLTTIKSNKAESTQVISGHSSYFIFNFIQEYRKFQQQLISEIIDRLKEVQIELEDDSENLGDLLAEIEEATKQLNRLAINASIEANKAGEEGRGFSVVAEEVKELADESNQLVDSIEEVNQDISGLSQQVTEVVNSLTLQRNEIVNNQQEERTREVIKLGIIDGGEIGTKLLEIFAKMDLIEVCCIAEPSKAAPVMKLAREKGLPTTTEIGEVVQREELDLILGVTDSEQIFSTIQENKKESTEFIGKEVSGLIYEMMEGYKKFQNELLETAIEHLNEIYTEIKENSRNINNFLGEIEQVTKNLNMLAVNASIEAARTGEKGSDFSIVADEIKELSEKSSDLVDEIEKTNNDVINLNNTITEVVSQLETQIED